MKKDKTSQVVYVATNVEKREGDDPEFFVLGVYTTLETAQAALQQCFDGDTEFIEEDGTENEWTRIELNKDLGSFRYEYDDYNYFEYRIDKKIVNN